MSVIKHLTNVGGIFLAFSKCILLTVSKAEEERKKEMKDGEQFIPLNFIIW